MQKFSNWLKPKVNSFALFTKMPHWTEIENENDESEKHSEDVSWLFQHGDKEIEKAYFLLLSPYSLDGGAGKSNFANFHSKVSKSYLQPAVKNQK